MKLTTLVLVPFAGFVMLTIAPQMSAQLLNSEIKPEEAFKIQKGNTIFLDNEADAMPSAEISEGIWCRKINGDYRFYTIDGKPFTDRQWRFNANREPRMTEWGLMLHAADEGYNSSLYLVKPDGSYTKAPADIVSFTEFVDGLAIAGIKDGYNVNYKYIKPDMSITFPHLNPQPSRFEGRNETTPPVSEGLRAYCTKVGYSEKWGYIDNRGKVVVEPQFNEARSFRCGRALVKDSEGNKYFIDTAGNKAFEPKWDKYGDVSDYDSGVCAADGENFNLTNYYDVNGNFIKTLTRGTNPHDNKIFYLFHNEEENKDYVHITSTGFEIGTQIDVKTEEFNEPRWDNDGVAHFTSRIIYGASNHAEQGFSDYTIGDYSGGYAPATMCTIDNKYEYKGFVDTTGNWILIYEVINR